MHTYTNAHDYHDIVQMVKFTLGSENDKNPVKNVWFYSKEDPWTDVPVPEEEVAIRAHYTCQARLRFRPLLQVSCLVLPRGFTEVEIRVYDKDYKRDHSPVKRYWYRSE